jgi:hypothetical protein
MNAKTRKLVIVGDSAFAEIAREYFDADTGYEVVAFSVETPFLKRETLHGLPVLPFETLEQRCDPAGHDVFVACTYTQLNRLRARLAAAARARGYKLASYVSPRPSCGRTSSSASTASCSRTTRSSPSSASARTSCCGAATTSATIPRSSRTSSSPRTS